MLHVLLPCPWVLSDNFCPHLSRNGRRTSRLHLDMTVCSATYLEMPLPHYFSFIHSIHYYITGIKWAKLVLEGQTQVAYAPGALLKLQCGG